MSRNIENFEVVIVGAGPAGLSAALALGRMQRKVLICDTSSARNLVASRLKNFPTEEDITPQEWRQKACKNLANYDTLTFLTVKVLDIKPVKEGFRVRLSTHQTVMTKKVLLCYGLQDRLPDIRNIRKFWGQGVYNCTYCHGFEVRGQKIALIGEGRRLIDLYCLASGLSEDIVVCTNQAKPLSPYHKSFLKKRGVPLIEDRVLEIVEQNKKVAAIKFKDFLIEVEAVFLSTVLPFKLKCDLADKLACRKNKVGLIRTDARGETSVEGVYAAGDLASTHQTVTLACASGTSAAFSICHDLLKC